MWTHRKECSGQILGECQHLRVILKRSRDRGMIQRDERRSEIAEEAALPVAVGVQEALELGLWICSVLVAQSCTSVMCILLSSERMGNIGSTNSDFKFLGGSECVWFDYCWMLSAWDMVKTLMLKVSRIAAVLLYRFAWL